MHSTLLKFILVLFVTLNITSSFAQDSLYTSSKKGKFFISWGGNRDNFTKSDIAFSGDNYNFTIEDVEAQDKPKGWHLDYINPTRMTIPQTNLRVGYFISDKYAVIIGFDHMKYVMKQNLIKNVRGEINLPTEEAGSVFNGQYNGQTFVSEQFLEFEYTDGLNYAFTEIARYDDISKWFGITNTDTFQINATESVGFGFIYPRTNSTLLLKPRNDAFSVSGYGTSLNLGLNLTFFKHFFIQTDLKGGYIKMNNSRTTSVTTDKASHDFFFLQRVISLGGIFRL